MKENVGNIGQAPDVLQPNELGKPRSKKTKAPAKAGPSKWLVAALLVLGVIPLAAGGLARLAGGMEITGFFALPLPVVLHVLSASVFAILGPFQFATSFRRRKPGWHRVAGLFIVLCGLIVGLSGLWLTLFYPGSGVLLYIFRILFGSFMIVSIFLGFFAIQNGDIVRHRTWMIRSYAIGIGAATQVLVLIIWDIFIGTEGDLSRGLLNGAGWMINLSVAEWTIRKRLATPSIKASASFSTPYKADLK